MALPPILRCTALVALSLLPLETHGQAPSAAVSETAELAAPVFQRSADGVVTITCATPGVVMRYSIDGSDPGPKTGPYLAPVELKAGGVIKARAFSEDRKQRSALAEFK